MLLTVRKIEVNNFMTHRQESIELPDSGTVLLWGPSGAGKCLSAGTTVWLPSGEPISIRQFVMGRFREVLGVIGDRIQTVSVTDWHELGDKPIIEVVLEDGTTMFCADSHPIQTPMGCMPVSELQVGMMVGRADPVIDSQTRWVNIAKLTPKAAMPCYDITVDTPEHLYLADGIVVHNSSLLDSIGFALYGLSATRASALDELRHELYPDEDFGVRVTFGLGEQQIQLFRGVEGGKSVVWMVDQDGTMTESPRAVSKQVEDLMGGMDSATFFSTYVSQQGELDSLVKMAGGGRRKFVQRMMGITLLDKVTTKINRELVKTTERIKFLDESMPELGKRDLLAAVAAAEKAHAEALNNAQTLQAELEAVRVQGEGLAARLKTSEETSSKALKLGPQMQALQETQLPALNEKIIRLEQELTASKAAAERLGKAHQIIQEIADLEAKAELLAGAEGHLAALGRLQQQYKSSEKALEAVLSRFSNKKDPKDACEHLQSLVKGLGEAIFGLESTATDLSQRMESLGENHDCWVCGQHIPDPEALKAHIQKELAGCQASISTKKEELAQAETQLQTAEDDAKTLQQAQEDHDRAKNGLQQAQADSAGADAEQLKTVRARLNELAETKAGLQQDQVLAAGLEQAAHQKEQTRKDLQTAAKQLADGTATLDGLDYNPNTHQELKDDTEAARARYMELRDDLAQVREQAQTSKLAAQTAQAAADQYDATQADRVKAEDRHGMLKRMELSMKAFKNYLIGQIRPTLQTLTSQHLSALTDGAMSGVEIDEEYNLLIHDGETSRRIGMCSGGEQARAAFSLRLALTQLVSKRTDTPVGFMVFDEIFGSQDEDHRRAILESLKYLRGVYPQILLISHSGEIRESDLVDIIVDVPDGDSVGRIQVSGR